MIWTFTLSRGIKLAAIFIVIPFIALTQSILNKTVSVQVSRQPVSSVLKTVSEQGKFYFSYNSNIIPGDSLVSLNLRESTVKQVLDVLFKNNYQYKEKGEYLIILPAPKEKTSYISGYVFDTETNAPADYASVYSRQLLISDLTGDDGRFRMRVKGSFPVSLTVSKVGYGDTTIVVQAEESHDLKINISTKAVDLDPLIVRYSEGASTWLGRLFLSARLRAQSRNISKFFVALPYQASLSPGLGTHGRMSSQVVNKFSLNLLGGYTAGVNGVELAGGFNMSKKDVQYVQMAGAFNVVSGYVKGVQIAGFLNHVLDSLQGVQVSGFSGNVKKSVRGVQVSGFLSRGADALHGVQVSGAGSIVTGEGDGVQVSGAYNHAADTFQGVQIAGGVNFVKSEMDGMQLSGVANIGKTEVKGFQLGFMNYAKKLKGVQLGIVNVADSSAGLSLGLINIIKKSNSNVSVYASEIVPLNLAWKMGTRKFYSMLVAGTTAGSQHKAYTFGAGIGREFRINKNLDLFTEITSQNVYLGSWEQMPSLYRFQTALNLKLSRRLILFAGPSFSMYHADQHEVKEGYKSFPLNKYPGFDMGSKLTSWFGWQGGLSFRYAKVD